MSKSYGRREVLSRLSTVSTGILGTLDEKSDNIRLRVMYYGVDDDLKFYLMSTKGSPKIDQILSSPNVTFIVFGLEEPYDQSWVVEVNGEAKLLKLPREVDNALDKLRDRNPFADVTIESGVSGQFDFLLVFPRIMRFFVYGEALAGESVTVLKLD